MAALAGVCEVDLRQERGWDGRQEKYLWVCDIEEKTGEGDNDFVFMANIRAGVLLCTS